MASPILVILQNEIVPENGVNLRHDLETPGNSVLDGEKVLNDKVGRGTLQKQGTVSPNINVGKTRLDDKSIMSMHIWQDELIPRISLTFIDTSSIFTSGVFPISKPIVSVQVTSSVKGIKSLSSDFLITNISSISSNPTRSNDPKSGSAAQAVYTITGELHIPSINGTVSKAISNKNSKDALLDLAKKLKLGFADNGYTPTDQMTWLIAQTTYREAIEHIAGHSYLNDKSFFHAFIDRWHNLTFINVEDVFINDGQKKQGKQSTNPQKLTQAMNTEKNDISDDGDDTVQSIILTNKRTMKNSDLYIVDYCLISNHGEILKNHSLRKYVDSYDHGRNVDHEQSDTVNFVSHYHEPLITPPDNRGFLPQTVELTEWAKGESVLKKWIGINYGNAHPNYKFAKLINEHNDLELRKNLLKIKLDGFNVNIIRGDKVAVEIYSERTDAMAKNIIKNDAEQEEDIKRRDEIINAEEDRDLSSRPDATVRDGFLSGDYYVMSMKHSCVYGRFETELLLARRDWQLPRAKKESAAQ